MLHRNALRLQRLVNTLLEYSRIEAGRIRASFQATDLSALTRELASVFRSAIEKAGMRLVVDCPPLAEPAYVDRDMYEKIVLNLLSNALKFTFGGEIEVRLRDAGISVELSVRDTGTGIQEEQLPHIFERFHRAEGVQGRTHEGTGIGLALVQELVKLHGGTVRVESVAGKGSTFTVSVLKGKMHLPADQIEATCQLAFGSVTVDGYLQEALRWLPGGSGQSPSLDSEMPEDVRSTVAAGVPRPRVVWADDNVDMRDYVGRLLAPLCDVEGCPDGETALAAVRREPPDLVLADVMMPRLDGFGLIRMLRADERTRFIPVVLVSARAGEEARVEGLQAGAEDYLVKPFSARELVARVETHVKLARVRRESAAALRYRVRQFETLLNVAPLGVYLINANFCVAQVNPIALQIFGNVPGGVFGRDFSQIIHLLWDRNHAEEIERIFRHTLATGESYFTPERAEFRIDRNVTEYYEWRLDRITLPDGCYGLVCYFRDVSQQVQARKLIEENRDALRESEKRAVADLEAMTSLQEVGNYCSRPGSDFHQCLDKILNAAIAITSADKGNIQLFDARSGILKIAAQRGFDRAFLDFFAEAGRNESAAYGGAVHAAHRVVIEDITRSHMFREQASLRVLLDAGVRAVQLSPLNASDGSVLGMISTHFAHPHRPTERQLRLVDLLTRQAADFLERKQAEEALREADRRKDEFLATLAHELRNPLAPIRNSLHILRLAGGEGRTAERVSEMMERQVNHMVRLVDDLMEVSRITSGKIELRKEQMELGDVVRSAIETSRPLIDAAHHQLALSLPTEPLTLEGDPVRLAQVLSNLLNNAAKYTAEWGQIRLAARRERSSVVVSVRDNGMGIPAEMLSKVFDLFTQVDRINSRTQGGLGIGLTLVRSLVEMHGGSVEARSGGPGQGSEFLVRLPLAMRRRNPFEQGQREDGTAATASRRILVVDDNRDCADSLGMLLKFLGADVCIANDGPAALEALETYQPSVVFLDIGMPGMDGYEVARRARQLCENRDITLIALTGWGQEEDLRRSKEAGIDHHLVKPLSLGALQGLLASLPREHPKDDDAK